MELRRPERIGTHFVDRIRPGGDVQIVPQLFDIARFIGGTVEDEFAIDAAQVVVRIQFDGQNLSALCRQNEIQPNANTVGLGFVAKQLRVAEQKENLLQPVKICNGDHGFSLKRQYCPGKIFGKLRRFRKIGEIRVNRPMGKCALLIIEPAAADVLPGEGIIVDEYVVVKGIGVGILPGLFSGEMFQIPVSICAVPIIGILTG